MTAPAFLRCIDPECAAQFDVGEERYACEKCGSLLDVAYDWSHATTPKHLSFFEGRWGRRNSPLDFSGVWRFRELLPFAPEAELVTLGEGQTILQSADPMAMGLPLRPGRLHLQYEGMNPSGSFKDNGMAAAFTMARRLCRQRVGCASTGNTSASMAMYGALTRSRDGAPMRAIVFVGQGKIAYGKLSQALDHGAVTIQIEGDFDACMSRIKEASSRLGLYLMNSVNPFRLEGQKTIMYRVLEGLGWRLPDWIIVPGGNLGNTSAFGKAFAELIDLGLVNRAPRLAVVNAEGANTLFQLHTQRGIRWNQGRWDRSAVNAFYDQSRRSGRRAATIATAIEIGEPVNLAKALRSLDVMHGVVCEVSDEEILGAKALVGRCGFGCEPASAASVAGLRKLLAQGVIESDAEVVCILTGHALKDSEATVNYHTKSIAGDKRAGPNQPIRVRDDIDEICRAIEGAA